MSYKHRNGYLSNIVIDGENYTKYFTFPFTVQNTLDESLDSAMIQLSNMKRKEPFKPFTDAELGTDADGRIDMLVANDEVTEVFGRGLYNHQITLIEPTKLLERYVMSAKAFTNHQASDDTWATKPALAKITNQWGYFASVDPMTLIEETSRTTSSYLTPIFKSNTLIIPPIKEVFPDIDQSGTAIYPWCTANKVNLFFSKTKPQDSFDTSNMIKIWGWKYVEPFGDLHNKTIDLDLLSLGSVVGYTSLSGYYLIEYTASHYNFSPVIDEEGYAHVPDSGALTEPLEQQIIIKVGTVMLDISADEGKKEKVEPYTMQNVLWNLALVMEPLKEGEPWRFSYEFTDPQLIESFNRLSYCRCAYRPLISQPASCGLHSHTELVQTLIVLWCFGCHKCFLKTRKIKTSSIVRYSNLSSSIIICIPIEFNCYFKPKIRIDRLKIIFIIAI